ncbi:hypothetical protein [Algoriphagus sp.]|uniref:hypothetical protein n=1 Tax=Algoriphagus sp. TaxID=1872435 RepID=UPI0025D3E06F|nr:hypothetical protein [Algoriphagus sp.]
MNRLNQLFWKRVTESTQMTLESLVILRILAGLFFLIIYSPFFSWIGEVPQAFFFPPTLSLANLFSGFPPAYFFYGLDILITLALLGVTLGYKAKVSGIVASILLFIGFNWQYSMGKIDHNILLLAFLAIMSFSGWGSNAALVPDRSEPKGHKEKATSLLAVLLCFGMFSAGFLKAYVWLDFDPTMNGFLRWYYSGLYGKGTDYFFIKYLQELIFWWLDLMDYGGVLFEWSPFLFLLIGRKSWRLWLLGATLFHLTNLLILNIPFTPSFIIYLTFLNLEVLYPKIERLFEKKVNRQIFVGLVVLLGVNRLLYSFSIPYSYFEFLKQRDVIMYLALILWVSSAGLFARNIWKLYFHPNNPA